MIYFMTNASTKDKNPKYRGKDISLYGVESIHQRINNNFDDLYIGDYFDINITTKYCTESVRLTISDYNTFFYTKGVGNGAPAITQPHITLVPKSPLTTNHTMNPTATTTGGFTKTDMYMNILPVYEAAFLEALDNHLLKHRNVIAINNSGEYMNTGHEQYIQLLTEEMITGVSKSSYHMIDCSNLYNRLKIFDLDKAFASSFSKGPDVGYNYWLQNIVSSTEFAMYGQYGGIRAVKANEANVYIRPFMCMC